MENLLLKVFSNLNDLQVEYCLLRGEDELSQSLSFKEIDILVNPEHLKKFEKEVLELGFVSVPSWGHEPHHFFVAFEKETGGWLKLDVVDNLCYGKPIRYLSLDDVRFCLENRANNGELDVISPDNELLTLLLHCVLDKGEFQEKHKQRLAGLKDLVNDNPELKENLVNNLNRYLPESFKWNVLEGVIERADWQWIIDRQDAIKNHLISKPPTASLFKKAKTTLLRLFRPLLFVIFRHGVSVALLAPDGAGKSTLADTLRDERIIKAKLIYMGSNTAASNVGLPTTIWLKEKLKAAQQAEKKGLGRSLIGGANFVNRLLEQWLRYGVGLYHKWRGRVVVFDRYVYDAFLAPPAKTFGKRLRRGLLLKTCPAPDIVFLLDAPGEVLFARKGEHSPERLEKQRQMFLSLQDRIPNMVIVDVTQPADVVKNEVLARIWSHYGNHKATNGQ